MEQLQADHILNSMVAFIRQHGKEEVARIEKSAGDEFTIQKNGYVDEEKKKITENYKSELANQEVRLKIEKSKQQNTMRIERMAAVNKITEKLKGDLKKSIREEMNNNQDAYKQLLKNLMIQVSKQDF